MCPDMPLPREMSFGCCGVSTSCWSRKTPAERRRRWHERLDFRSDRRAMVGGGGRYRPRHEGCRQYSLCGGNDRAHVDGLGILLEPEGCGGSRCAHAEIAQGDVVEISAPRNLFALERIGRDFALHYCIRTASRAAFRDRTGKSPHAGTPIIAPQCNERTPSAGSVSAGWSPFVAPYGNAIGGFSGPNRDGKNSRSPAGPQRPAARPAAR
jgi:hypothetical protein